MSQQYRYLPRKRLSFFPAPLPPLNRLSDRLAGPHILMKRDGQTGHASGSNKICKLDADFDLSDIMVHQEFLGDGYGVVGDLLRRAIRLTAETEGILLIRRITVAPWVD